MNKLEKLRQDVKDAQESLDVAYQVADDDCVEAARVAEAACNAADAAYNAASDIAEAAYDAACYVASDIAMDTKVAAKNAYDAREAVSQFAYVASEIVLELAREELGNYLDGVERVNKLEKLEQNVRDAQADYGIPGDDFDAAVDVARATARAAVQVAQADYDSACGVVRVAFHEAVAAAKVAFSSSEVAYSALELAREELEDYLKELGE
jgi:hypothetical protein